MNSAPGLVAVPCLELVYGNFALTLARLAQRLPAGSVVAFNALGGSIDRKRNQLVEDWLLPDPTLAWVLFVDSDQRIPLDVVDRLLVHDVPIVGGVITKKRNGQVVVRPHADDLVPQETPHLEALPDLDGGTHGFSDGRASGRLRLGGLQSIEAIGTGCLLVRRAVFETLPKPWFVCDQSADGIGTCEDLHFCDQARAAGFEVYADTDCVVGHLTVIAMTPAVMAVLPREAFTQGNGEVAE